MDERNTPNRGPALGGPQRKALNAIVDANALISGVKRNTRDGIKKWINNGFIRLVVPMHTLKQLNMLSTTRTDRFGSDARDTLVWLDQITEQPNITSEGWVKLQEGHEEYATWEEVERFMLPRTLLAHTESETPVNGSIAGDADHLQIDDGAELASTSSKASDDFRPVTPSSLDSQYSATSTRAFESSPQRIGNDVPDAVPHHRKIDSATSMADFQISNQSADSEPRVPKSLQPLFNHIIWRINHTQSLDADQGLGSYILLTNDHLKQSIAHRFGIRVKRIEQLRDMISREERDMKNRLAVLKKECESDPSQPSRPGGALAVQSTGDHASPPRRVQAQRVLDPNAFERAASPAVRAAFPDQHSKTLPLAHTEHAGRGSMRGRGGRARAAFGTSRGTLPTHGGRGGQVRGGAAAQEASRPIDPDSFERPRGNGGSARAGSGRRKLWEPA